MFSTRFVLLLCTACLLFSAQRSYCVPTVFDRSVRLYKAQKYDSTITLIREYLRRNGTDPSTMQLVPLINEAFVRRGEYVSAHRLFSMYRAKYPESPFMARLWYVEGVALAKEEKYPLAINAFSTALKTGLSPALDSLTLGNVEKICMHMAMDEFDALAGRDIGRALSEIVAYHEIDKLIAIGQFAKAQTNADDFKARFPRSRHTAEMRDLMLRAQDEEKRTLQIGLLAPVSGEDEEIGKRVVQGAQLAINQLQPSTGQTVKSVVLDTKGSMITTAQKTQELLDVHKVSLVVGPVLSQNAIVAAAMLIDKPAVMISPTATDEGIADMGDNIFQMNVTTGVLGRKIARYAVENLSIKEFVILAPQTAYGRILAESFKDAVRKMNGEIVDEQYFEEGANDFREQFQAIRNKLLTRHLERTSIERGGDFRGTVSYRDSIVYSDSTLAVGGVFIPAEAEDIVMLAPQVAFHRIRTQILGSSGWHQPSVLKDGKRYVVNTVFSTTFELDQSQKEWADFSKAYRSRYNAEPDRVAALGYDAAALIMKAIRETGSDDPVRIRNFLAKTSGYRGLSGVVSFEDGHRTNSESAVYKITESGFVRVQ